MEVIEIFISVCQKIWGDFTYIDWLVVVCFSLSWAPLYLIAKYVIEPVINFLIPPRKKV